MKIINILLVLFLTFQTPVKAETNTYEINSIKDLVELSEKCHSDIYTSGLKVSLNTDLSLKDVDDFNIAYFSGTFDGNGHTISDLKTDGKYAPYGFIATLSNEGVVKNLNIEGFISPDGKAEDVGGIVGINYGRVENSSFKGSVIAKNNVGGIVGNNQGDIINCSTYGFIEAKIKSGGIAGYNTGLIKDCKNEANVNTRDNSEALSIEDIDSSTIEDLLKTNSSFIDAGGIVGYSTGQVINCNNSASIGYKHLGYNIGGIVGRSSGYVSSCLNTGDIDGRKDVGGIVGQMEPDIREDISLNTIGQLRNQFKQLNTIVNNTTNSLNDNAEDIKITLDSMSDALKQGGDALKNLDFEINKPEDGGLEDLEINVDLSELDKALDKLVNCSKKLNSQLKDDTKQLADNVNEISGKVTQISDTAISILDKKEESIYIDKSYINVANIRKGKVEKCDNKATIKGDLNVGGIAGVMSIQKANNQEDDDLFSFDLYSNEKYEVRALIVECNNEGYINAKRNDAGGICGKQVLGYIADNKNTGDIFSDAGNNVGGICGTAKGRVVNNSAKNFLSGKNYIGGIAGQVADSATISNNVSMVQVIDYGQNIGAIAGVLNGAISKNYFVYDGLDGINQISYAGVAEPISYEDICKKDEMFATLKMSFIVDDENVKTIYFKAGDSFNEDIYPKIKTEDGNFIKWNVTNLDNLNHDIRAVGENNPYVSTLASSLQQNGKKVCLVEGDFKEEDNLIFYQSNDDYSLDSYTIKNIYKLNIPNDAKDSHVVRLLMDLKDDLFIDSEEGLIKLNHETIGSYEKFTLNENQATLIVASNNHAWLYVFAIAALLIVLASMVILINDSHKGRYIIPVVIVLMIVALVFTAKKNEFKAYKYLNDYLSQDSYSAEIDINYDEGPNSFKKTVKVARKDGYKVIDLANNNFYLKNNIIYLEDGTAFKIDNYNIDYDSLISMAYDFFLKENVKKIDDVYSLKLSSNEMKSVMEVLLPNTSYNIESPMTVELAIKDNKAERLSFISDGVIDDNTYSLRVDIKLNEEFDVNIPNKVKEAKEEDVINLLSDDVVELYYAFTSLDYRNVNIELQAEIGPLKVKDNFDYSLNPQYVNLDKLIDVVYDIAMNSKLSYNSYGDEKYYNFNLDEEQMKNIIKEFSDLDVSLKNGEMNLMLKDGKICSLNIKIDGALTSLSCKVNFK